MPCHLTPWTEAANAWYKWRLTFNPIDEQRFRQAAQKEVDFLKDVLEKLEKGLIWGQIYVFMRNDFSGFWVFFNDFGGFLSEFWRNMPEVTKNMAETYRQTYNWLFAQQSKELQEKILAAVKDTGPTPPEVKKFIDNVIAVAEKGS